MSFVSTLKDNETATITLNRGKVNAINEQVVDQFDQCLDELDKDNSIKSIILTGEGKFFSFGFDIPEFLQLSKEQFFNYLVKFTNLYTKIFLFPKPIIAALNGHTIAGGCMLANACDFRIMVSGKAKISLNEMTFGASVFTGSVEILKYCVGCKNAEQILISGAMYSAEDALNLGLINQISSDENLINDARKTAGEFARKDRAAFTGIKRLLRQPIVDSYIDNEKKSIDEFMEIWYSESTWKQLEQIKIHS